MNPPQLQYYYVVCVWGISNSTLFGPGSLDRRLSRTAISDALMYGHVDLLHGYLFFTAPRTSMPTPVGYLPAKGKIMAGMVGEEEKPQVAIPLPCRSPVVPGPARGEVDLFFRTSRGPRLLAVLGLTSLQDGEEVEPAHCRGQYEPPKLPLVQDFLLPISLPQHLEGHLLVS